MTPDEYARMISNQPGATAGLNDPGLVLPLPNPPRVHTRTNVSGPDNGPGLNDSQIYAEFRKPDGSSAWLQKDNREVYERKGYTLTGREGNIEQYNDEVQRLDKWRAIGNHPGEVRATWPPAAWLAT